MSEICAHATSVRLSMSPPPPCCLPE